MDEEDRELLLEQINRANELLEEYSSRISRLERHMNAIFKWTGTCKQINLYELRVAMDDKKVD